MFCFDLLAGVMTSLVGLMGLLVVGYSARYMRGDRRYWVFIAQLVALVVLAVGSFTASHLLPLWTCMVGSHFFLIRLIGHKRDWPAARASSRWAGFSFLASALLLGAAFLLLSMAAGSSSIHAINNAASSPMQLLGLTALMTSALIQSAAIPFHRWLFASTNAPTPVSAIMHGGLINGGGFLLARFAPLYLQEPLLLTLLFALGMVTATVGTFCKLIQTDIKRMLTASTLGQMGFMLAECGMGLFSVAIAHLCWHGLYKSYLFLSSGSVLNSRRPPNLPPSAGALLVALAIGFAGSALFALSGHFPWLTWQTSSILVLLILIASTQLALAVMGRGGVRRAPLALIITLFFSAVYGFSFALFEQLFVGSGLQQPQPLNPIYLIGTALLLTSWLAMVIRHKLATIPSLYELYLRIYCRLLNWSQPPISTVTPHRNLYRH